MCCDSWGCKESDTTEQLNRTECLPTRTLKQIAAHNPWTISNTVLLWTELIPVGQGWQGESKCTFCTVRWAERTEYNALQRRLQDFKALLQSENAQDPD